MIATSTSETGETPSGSPHDVYLVDERYVHDSDVGEYIDTYDSKEAARQAKRRVARENGLEPNSYEIRERLDHLAHDRPCRRCKGPILPMGDFFQCDYCGEVQLPCHRDGCDGYLEHGGIQETPLGPTDLAVCNADGCDSAFTAPTLARFGGGRR